MLEKLICFYQGQLAGNAQQNAKEDVNEILQAAYTML